MFVIAGLGNPGKKYENTRHNMGFRVVDKIAQDNNVKVNKIKHKALVGDFIFSGQKVLLVKPQTYMNSSGESLREVVEYYGVDPSELIVVYDDMDLQTGGLRIRKKGSSGSHNGMKSVIGELQTQDFPRIRVGIGKTGSAQWRDFVTGKVSKEEDQVLQEAIDKAADAALSIVIDGVDIAMNRYNVKAKAPERQSSDQKGND